MRSLILNSRAAALRDDEGSGLILVFLVMLISSALSLVLLEGAVSMAKQTSANNKRVTSISAAQAGIDAGLGQIRGAVDSTGTGDVGSIPCTLAGGQVGGTNSPSQGTSTGSYQLTVAYFSTDPTAQTDLWRSNSANQINCPAGAHPDKVPSYALVTATGTSAAGKPRTVQSTYIFTTTNQNISGGLIHVTGGGQGGIPDLCPDAGSAHPSIGDTVTMQPCDPNDQGQRWAYQSDLSFLLTSTTNDSGTKAPMCIQAAGSPAPAGTPLKMAACSGQPTTGTVTLQQQFSYDDGGRLESSKLNTSTGKGTLSGSCWVVTSANTAGSGININSCGTVWRPEAAVGAGMAGAATMQLVNYAEFGRCLDATNQDPTYAFMIAYPCKQSPNPAELTWNQLYSYNPTTGQISTHDTANNITYCLTSPMATQATPTSPGGPFVRLNPCPTTALPANMKWTEVYDTGNYLTSWVIHDSSSPQQLCLGLSLTGTGTASTSGLGEWDSLYVETCDGSLDQKWNAPPNVPLGSVTGTHEGGTSGG
jgi:hypothetical protein